MISKADSYYSIDNDQFDIDICQSVLVCISYKLYHKICFHLPLKLYFFCTTKDFIYHAIFKQKIF